MAVKEYSLKRDGEKKLSEHFRVREFKCKDGSDKILVNEELPKVLEELRQKVGSDAVIITSGYRTQQHNAAVGGAKASQHLKGNAADIQCKKGGAIIPAKEICCALEDMGHAGGVGYISGTAVHVDVRGSKSWFDEAKGRNGIESFYEYFGLKKPEAPAEEDSGKISVGSIVTVTDGDVGALAVLTALLVAGALLWLRPVMYVAFDREFARSRGIHTRVISYLLAALIAVTIVLSIRIMGIVLLISLLTIPVVIANSFSKSFRRIALVAPVVAVAGNVGGLVLSYGLEVPPGAAIIFILTLLLVVARLRAWWLHASRRAGR